MYRALSNQPSKHDHITFFIIDAMIYINIHERFYLINV